MVFGAGRPFRDVSGSLVHHRRLRGKTVRGWCWWWRTSGGWPPRGSRSARPWTAPTGCWWPMAAERRRGLARLGTVRVRTTLAAVVVVGLAMAVGGVALVAVLRGVLTRELRTAARLRATELATDLRSGARPAELAVGGRR
jgi:hypothetical protein